MCRALTEKCQAINSEYLILFLSVGAAAATAGTGAGRGGRSFACGLGCGGDGRDAAVNTVSFGGVFREALLVLHFVDELGRVPAPDGALLFVEGFSTAL